MIRWARWDDEGRWHALAFADRSDDGASLITACGVRQSAALVVHVTLGFRIDPSIGRPCEQCDGLVLMKRTYAERAG